MLAIDIVASGLVLGGIYVLIALGLSLQYGVARIMNLAYGEFLIAAGFLAYAAFTLAAIDPLLTMLAAVPLAFAVNWLVYRLLLTPLVRRARDPASLELDSILGTFGLLFAIQGGMFAIFGGAYYGYSYMAIPVRVFDSVQSANKLLALAMASLLALGLYWFLTRTRAGTAVRAAAVDPQSAQLVAIDVPRLLAASFALGGALVAAAGVLLSMFLTFNAAMGVNFTMKALIVIIMGGVGSLPGALLAGLTLGLMETAVARLVDPGLTLAFTYALFLAVLLVRPAGLFGRPS